MLSQPYEETVALPPAQPTKLSEQSIDSLLTSERAWLVLNRRTRRKPDIPRPGHQ
ncbi:hypothetical protein [Ktedonobacter racemifer]|uniref:hypothetical protein n=1 Tax=Ktedonobacter racemifer TaxID=363277 RepID=UPI0012F95CAF|nr:hypothetical protein [Ktedonobacter racemifer]